MSRSSVQSGKLDAVSLHTGINQHMANAATMAAQMSKCLVMHCRAFETCVLYAKHVLWCPKYVAFFSIEHSVH